MPTSHHHNEWLSLIEVSGPFLSVPVLERVFPHGLDAHDAEHARLLKLAFEEWEDNQQDEQPNPAIRREWINFVLKQTLGLPDEVLVEGQAIPQTLRVTIAEQGETLRPDLVVKNPADIPNAGKPRLLIQTYPPTQDPEKPIPGRHWKASPASRMMELLHATETRLGLVTNGEQWMLVDAPKGETTGFASWYANLWFEEPLTLRAFRSLLGVYRFFSAADDETLEAMLKESASNQQEVTDRLGYQVREAVEVIIRSLDRIDQDEKGRLLSGVSEPELYEAALTVMMRLVFLFSAEERGLLLLGDPLYDEHYAVSTLVAKLQEAADQHGEEVLERRHDAWVRLLSTFRAVYGGVQHDRLKLLPYAGRLFDPDRFPFLEGRRPGTTWKEIGAAPLPIDNRTVLHLLRSLQYLEMHGEARRLSFRALDIEQIGHVYEGLLDHTAKRAAEPMLSLNAAKGDEPEVALSELERLRTKGEAGLVKFLREQTGRSENALMKAIDGPVAGDAAKKLRAVCGDDRLFNRLQPFSGLIRDDTFDRPVVIRAGSVFVTVGPDRRSTGTHYTPRSLTEPIVQYTLEPLVYIGPAEGRPKEEWVLRSAKELLALKLCDMACGSGAFLVQACRYLSERLVEAWEDAEKRHPGVPGITPEGTASTGAASEQLIPKDADERLAYARRIAAQRCLYGVDKNPLAVEMAKLSLWLLTLAKDKPFTFLDHAIRCGDSLVGIRDIRQVQFFQLDLDRADRSLFAGPIMRLVDQAAKLREKIEAHSSNSVEDVREKERILKEAEEKTAQLGIAADLLISVEFQSASTAGEKDDLHNHMAIQVGHHVQSGTTQEFRSVARNVLSGRRTFHWPLEFPEVFLDGGGFHAFMCNPPFMGGQLISNAFGSPYRSFLVSQIGFDRRGSADLCTYFMLRAGALLRIGGSVGLIETNTVAEGETRLVGLEQLPRLKCEIRSAVSSMKWPGSAALEVAVLWISRGDWNGLRKLDGKEVSSITSSLSHASSTVGLPHRLSSNRGFAFKGSSIQGVGFLLSPEDARALIRSDKRNKEVLFPYLGGEDVTTQPDGQPTRWTINFFDWPLEKAELYATCLELVRDRVKPERERAGTRNAIGARRAKYWWKYDARAGDLYEAVSGLSEIWVVAKTSKYLAVLKEPTDVVFSDGVIAFASDADGVFAILASAFHAAWAEEYTSTLETRLRYTVADAFETFAFPEGGFLTSDRGGTGPLKKYGRALHEHRMSVMNRRSEGITKTYNRYHSPEEAASDIQKLRDLHVEMDKAVATAYGWDDLGLGHGFHETKQGVRFTISEPARREVLARLLKLNHERYAEEVEQGLHDKKGKPKPAARGPAGKPSATFVSMPLKYDDDGESGTADDLTENTAAPARERTPRKSPRADRRIQPSPEPSVRPAPIDHIETDEIMAAFRQASRGRGWLDRDELLKEVSVVLGYQRLGPNIDEALRGHLRSAIRRRIIEADGPNLVRAGTVSMADYELEDLRETFRSVMRKGTTYEREDVIHSLARYLGFARVTDTSRDAIKSAINSGIRQGILGYEGSVVWREQ
jgi:hypothetical protein